MIPSLGKHGFSRTRKNFRGVRKNVQGCLQKPQDTGFRFFFSCSHVLSSLLWDVCVFCVLSAKEALQGLNLRKRYGVECLTSATGTSPSSVVCATPS